MNDTTRGSVRPRRALLSVSDKTGLAEFAAALHGFGCELVSTGGTARALRDAGLPVKDVSELTGFPEMLDGRVKTLHPMVHGGLLYRRDIDEHVRTIAEHGIAPIDLVCVNLYPFEETVARPGVTEADAIENIDIGGPSMLRSAAKNFASVAVICDPARYADVLGEMNDADGATSFALRRELATEVFARTAAYDAAIAAHFGATDSDGLPERLSVTADRSAELRYGENPHQPAAVYANRAHTGPSVVSADQLHGKPLSYNNLLDAAAALELVLALRRLGSGDRAHQASACVVKHTNPCGAARASSVDDAVRAAIAGDPLAAFGGILAVDTEVDAETAVRIAAPDRFFEVVIAPSFAADALETLQKRWANVRLLAIGDPEAGEPERLEHRSLPGGVLVQARDLLVPDPASWTHAAGPAPDAGTLRAAAMLEGVVRALMSNAVCLGGADADESGDAVRLFGAGAGQMDRVASCRLAIEKAGERAAGAIALSDAFFPFPDGPGLLIDAGVRTIVHPGGSKRDGETFELCDRRGVTCLTTGMRRFRH